MAQAAGGLVERQAARPGTLQKHGGVAGLQAGEGGDGLGVIPATGPGRPGVEHDAAAEGDHRALPAQDEAVSRQSDDGLGEAELGEALLAALDGRPVGLNHGHDLGRGQEQAQPGALLQRLGLGQPAYRRVEDRRRGHTRADPHRPAPELLLGHAPEHRLGERAFAPGWLQAHHEALLTHLEEHHQSFPLSRGPGRRALRRGLLLALEPSAFDVLIERAVASGDVRLDGPRLQRPGFAPSLVGEDLAAWTTLLGRLSAAGLGALEPRELTEGLPRGEALLNLCFEEGRVETLDGRPTDKAALDGLVAQVRQVLTDEGQLTPARFKELTGLSRKHAIPLLEWLDAQRVTRRAGEGRVPFAG